MQHRRREKPSTVRPPRTETRFRFRELARAVKAAKAEGGERVEVDPISGKITVIIGNAAAPAAAAAADASETIVKLKKG